MSTFVAESQSETVQPGTWTPERVEQLARLWGEGVPTAEMGRQLSLVTPEAGPVSKNAVIGKRVRVGLEPRIVLKKPAPRRDIFEFADQVCMWPIGHPGDESFHFCGSGELKPGKPYCYTHAKEAYIPPKAPELEAA